MGYMTVREAGVKWGMGVRSVSLYCNQGKVEGAVKKGRRWLIPQDAAKPGDGKKREDTIPTVKEPAICQELLDLYEQRKRQDPLPWPSPNENQELLARIVKHLPHPLHICAPDGTLLWANEAFLKFAQITKPEKLYQKHNIILNPALGRWGVQDFVLRAFRGEIVHARDIKVPHQEIVERLGDDHEAVLGTMFHNMTAFPIRNEQQELLYIVTVFTISRYYQDKEEIMKGKEYIYNHWQEEFDIDQLAGSIPMSRYHYTRLFKEHTGMTPYNYYQNIKIDKIKEKLCDQNLSVGQAFAQCGVDYNSNYTRLFKQKVGLTPYQYHNMMTEK